MSILFNPGDDVASGDLSLDVRYAVEDLMYAPAEDRGAVFTKPEVSTFLLDLAGWTVDQRLHARRLLEPSCGDGAILLPAIRRLLECATIAGIAPEDFPARLRRCITAVEVHADTVVLLREQVACLLVEFGVTPRSAGMLAKKWVINSDFLLWRDCDGEGAPGTGGFDVIVGNPPYLRPEAVAPVLLALYRRRFQRTMRGRADLYIPFFEHALSMLRQGGRKAFICSDRWTKNAYGKSLRQLIATDYSLAAFVDMSEAQPFTADVGAYTAVTVIDRRRPVETFFAHAADCHTASLQSIHDAFAGHDRPGLQGGPATRQDSPPGAPWVFVRTAQDDPVMLARGIEEGFPLIEQVGCRVGIGVATGADAVFVGRNQPVEPERQIKLLLPRDLRGDGGLSWSGNHVVNPFAAGGGLVPLEDPDSPRFAAFIRANEERLRARAIARSRPAQWYRTIDRIDPGLTATPKLLIADIKGVAGFSLDRGEFYPLHGIYFITSDDWPLEHLQTLIQAGIAQLFVSVYATRIGGGWLRFQAQYLRRIRLPAWSSVKHIVEPMMEGAGCEPHDLIAAVYGLSGNEALAIAALAGSRR